MSSTPGEPSPRVDAEMLDERSLVATETFNCKCNIIFRAGGVTAIDDEAGEENAKTFIFELVGNEEEGRWVLVVEIGIDRWTRGLKYRIVVVNAYESPVLDLVCVVVKCVVVDL